MKRAGFGKPAKHHKRESTIVIPSIEYHRLLHTFCTNLQIDVHAQPPAQPTICACLQKQNKEDRNNLNII